MISNRRHRRSKARTPRGNTLVLVTAILVLLVIIATAYISRAQGGRIIASAQRKAIDREDRSQLVAGVLSQEIADGLFPALVDNGVTDGVADPGLSSPMGVASSGWPRQRFNFWSIEYPNFWTTDNENDTEEVSVEIDRYSVDPQQRQVSANELQVLYPYNFAPYATKPWTNWPDSTLANATFPGGPGAVSGGTLPGDDNPVGNPGFGDTRWLRSSEPERAYSNGRAIGFTHWRHLSWPATAENGWRVCPDISDIEANTITATAATQLGPGQDYLDLGVPVALQTPYEQWYQFITPQGFDTAAQFAARRDRWFGDPSRHFAAAANPGLALPNFIRLNDLGPRREAFSQKPLNDRPPRAEVERTYTDADGDGFTDSFWFVVPGTSEDGVRQVVGVSVVDNASRVDLETATRFDRWSTAGHTPADVALAGRLVRSDMYGSGQTQPIMDVDDPLVGLFSDPQNIWPKIPNNQFGYENQGDSNRATNWELDYFEGETAFPFRERRGGGLEQLSVQTGWDPTMFGDTGSTTSATPTWLRQTGVVQFGSRFPEPVYRSSFLVANPFPANGLDGVSRGGAQLDRTRYFNRRRDGGGVFAFIADDNPDDFPDDPSDNFLALAFSLTRGFAAADELELRMFEGSNYGPVVSSLERSINRPHQLASNLFRSTLNRSESVENYLAQTTATWPPGLVNYAQGMALQGVPRSGDQLTARELLRDTRHRSTTMSGTRNDLRPPGLAPSAYFNPFLPRLGYGRIFDSTASIEDKVSMARADYERTRRKIDLRESLDARVTDFEAQLYRTFGDSGNAQDALFRGPFAVPGVTIGDYYSLNDPDPNRVRISRLLSLDRAFRFRWSLQDLFDRAMSDYADVDGVRYYQSYFGSNFANEQFNLLAYQKSRLASASWAANIDTMRDRQLRPVIANDLSVGGQPQEGVLLLDAPIYPDFAPRVSPQDNNLMPQELRNLVFPGMEKQPFIMEAYFSMVYPPGRMTNDDVQELKDLGYEQFCEVSGLPSPQWDSDEFRTKIPPGFPDSGERWVDRRQKPAVVFAIQLANPFDDPVPLHDVFIRVGETGREGSGNTDTLTRTLNFGKLPSPHPSMRTDGRVNPYYTPAELFLGPTKPDAPRTAIVFGVMPPRGVGITGAGSDFESSFGLPYPEFHAKWRDFLDVEPGALFGWDPNLAPSQHQTIVVDASPRTYVLTTPETGTEFVPPVQPLFGLDVDDWFTDVDQSVELYRYVFNPATYDYGAGVPPFQNEGRLYCIDRLDNEQTGDEIEFCDDLEKLGEAANFLPPEPGFDFERTNPGRNNWAGIRLAGDDAFVNYVRAGRAWGWDVNRNGIYDMTETNPRYAYSVLPGGDWSQSSERSVDESGVERQINGTSVDYDDDPDGEGASGRPWISRSYLSPLALNTTISGGPFLGDFFGIRGKPVHLTTATAVQGQPGIGEVRIDYDAGFPVQFDGTLRETSLAPWPGRPANLVDNWVLMDKGQKPDETANGRRGVNGVEQYDRIWLERECWAMPLQMLQKDDDLEQVGEVLNAFIWGHALDGVSEQILSVRGHDTVATFSEIMASSDADDLFPVRATDESEDLGYPGIYNARINRYRADPGELSRPVSTPYNGFRPYTQVLEVTAIDAPWVPKLPAGLSMLDGLVCDGPGSNHRLDVFNDGLDSADVIYEKDLRFGNAAGFSGEGVRGLINLNTASPEVMRTLPQMSRIAMNDYHEQVDTSPDWGREVFARGWVNGDLDEGLSGDQVRGFWVNPRPALQRNAAYVRIPEAITRYRDGATWFARQNEFEIDSTAFDGSWELPFFLDRGTFDSSLAATSMAAWTPPYPSWSNSVGLFPGMRRGTGIESIGELLLVDRAGNKADDSVPNTWIGSSSAITAAAANVGGVAGQVGLELPGGAADYNVGQAGIPSSFDVLRLGWSDGLQLDARLATDRQPVRWSIGGNTQVQPDVVAGDAEEANLLFAGISNLVSVRSDTFSVHFRIRSFKQNPVTGVWNATDPDFIVDDSRYLMVVDRSRCDQPGDRPEVKLLTKLPE